MTETMRQIAVLPESLVDLVNRLSYKAGWHFTLGDVDRGQGSEGLTLEILITTADSYHPDRKRSVMHYMPVPPAAYNEQSWTRWLFDQIRLVEQHEECEFFQIDGVRPYAPNHGPGWDPYIVTVVSTPEDAATKFTGERLEVRHR